MNARREIISFWVGLGPSVKGEIKMRKEVQEPNKTSSCHLFFNLVSIFNILLVIFLVPYLFLFDVF